MKLSISETGLKKDKKIIYDSFAPDFYGLIRKQVHQNYAVLNMTLLSINF